MGSTASAHQRMGSVLSPASHGQRSHAHHRMGRTARAHHIAWAAPHSRARHGGALPRSQQAKAPHNGHGAAKVLGQELLRARPVQGWVFFLYFTCTSRILQVILLYTFFSRILQVL